MFSPCPPTSAGRSTSERTTEQTDRRETNRSRECHTPIYSNTSLSATRVSFPATLKSLQKFITCLTPGSALRSDWIYLSFMIRVLSWGLSVMQKSPSSSKRISLFACIYSCPCPVFCVRIFISWRARVVCTVSSMFVVGMCFVVE